MSRLVAETPPLFAEPAFRRMFVYSAVGHLVLLFLLLFSPEPAMVAIAPTPVFIEVASQPPAPAPPAKPKPAPAKPAPAPEKPEPPKQRVEEAVVIPKDPPKPKARPKPEPKPDPKPEPKPDPEPARPEANVEDLLAKLREKVESRESATSAPEQATEGRVDPELAAYRKAVQARIYAGWAGARQFRTLPDLQVTYEVEVGPTGNVNSVRKVRSSGNLQLDDSAERAIHKVKPFPPPPGGRARTLQLHFDPKELN